MYSSPAIKRISLSDDGTTVDSTGSKLDDASVETIPLRKHSRIDSMSMMMERPPAFNPGSTLVSGASLKLENSQLKIQVERLQLQLSNEKAQHERVALALEARIVDRAFLLNCDNKTKNELQETKAKQKEELEAIKSQLMTARKEISQFNDTLFEHKNMLREKEMSLQKLQQQLIQTQFELSDHVQQAKDQSRANAVLVHQQQNTIQELEARLSKAPEVQQEVQPQKHDTSLSSNKKVADLESHLRRLMYENGVLKDAAAHGRLMAEKLREAEQQLEAHRETEKRLYEVEAELQLLKRQSSSQPGAANTNALTTKDIRDLMEKSMCIPNLQESISNLNAENIHLRNEIVLLRGQIDALVGESRSLQDQLNTQSKQLTESLLLESSQKAEIASLKAQIAALEKIEESSQSLLDSLRQKTQSAEQISTSK